MQSLSAGRLSLEPLTVAHADEMFVVLTERELYRHLDYGPPPSVEHLRSVYAKLERRVSPNGTQDWLNWIVRLPDNRCIGFVQATLVDSHAAWVAFVFASSVWGTGVARTSTATMIEHLHERYARSTFLATTEAANARSVALLNALSFRHATRSERDRYAPSPTERLFVRRIAQQSGGVAGLSSLGS